MKYCSGKTFVTATVALLLTSLVLPSPAYAAPRDVGILKVDCDTDWLESQVVNYLAIGDRFRIQNDNFEPCLILDPNGILTGEDADFGLGPGVLGLNGITAPITINAEGAFTITENGGTGNPGAVVSFRVAPVFDFTNSSDIGRNPLSAFSHRYEGVTQVNGTTVDATVTITQRANLDPNNFDLDFFDADRPFNPEIGTSIFPGDPSQEGHVDYTVAFHADNDPSTPVTLSNFSITVKDIDTLQYLAVENVDSFTLSQTPATNLTARSVGNTLFIEELGDITSDDEDQDHWAVLSFDAASTVTLRLGTRDGRGAYFGVLFSSTSGARAEFSNPSITGIQGPPAPPAPAATTPPTLASTPPTLAATGANVGWMLAAGLTAVIAGFGFLASSRRKRTA